MHKDRKLISGCLDKESPVGGVGVFFIFIVVMVYGYIYIYISDLSSFMYVQFILYL